LTDVLSGPWVGPELSAKIPEFVLKAKDDILFGSDARLNLQHGLLRLQVRDEDAEIVHGLLVQLGDES